MRAGEAAALAAVGARFRPHGREPATGLDCVGVAALALAADGFAGAIPTGYALRGSPEGVAARLTAMGLRRVDAPDGGDILLLATGPGQAHLAVKTAHGIVHADAILRRVVERPGPPPWPLMGTWRGEATWRRSS